MDEVTQQNAALVEQAAGASESLKEQAMSLVEAVARFKLEGLDTPLRGFTPNTRPLPPARNRQIQNQAADEWSEF